MVRVLSFAVVLLSACSVVVDASTGITVDCERADHCQDMDAWRAIDVFRYEWDLDVTKPLSVTYVEDGSLAKPTDTGVTIDCRTIRVVNDKALLHELLHVRFCRESNDPDVGHHETPNGRWRYSHSLLLDLLETELAR